MKPKIKLGALILASSLMFGSLVGCKPSGGGGGPGTMARWRAGRTSNP